MNSSYDPGFHPLDETAITIVDVDGKEYKYMPYKEPSSLFNEKPLVPLSHTWSVHDFVISEDKTKATHIIDRKSPDQHLLTSIRITFEIDLDPKYNWFSQMFFNCPEPLLPDNGDKPIPLADLIESATVCIGNQEVQTLLGSFLDYDRISYVTQSKCVVKDGWNKKTIVLVGVLLPFFFTKSLLQSLPLKALLFHNVKIQLKMGKVAQSLLRSVKINYECKSLSQEDHQVFMDSPLQYKFTTTHGEHKTLNIRDRMGGLSPLT